MVLGCLLLLLAIVLPLVASSRDRTRRLACANNLRQIGIGLHDFHSARRSFPPGRDAKNDWQHNWATHLLPYVEQSELAEIYSFQHAWNEDSPGCQNRQVASSLVSLYRCPATEHAAAGEGDYGGNYGTQLTGLKAGFGRQESWGAGVLVSVNVPGITTQPIQLGQVRDGASQTFLVMECAGNSAELGGSWACGITTWRTIPNGSMLCVRSISLAIIQAARMRCSATVACDSLVKKPTARLSAPCVLAWGVNWSAAKNIWSNLMLHKLKAFAWIKRTTLRRWLHHNFAAYLLRAAAGLDRLRW